jgi:hypothetical protein
MARSQRPERVLLDENLVREAEDMQVDLSRAAGRQVLLVP